ncbi:MAG: S8 family peptidase [Candidatus Dadabacteria bacterium]|nr:S8 family peptidase [Candidatus Dadabacteria bacterium]
MDIKASATPRTREEHGVRLREQLQAAFRAFDSAQPQDSRLEGFGGVQGAFLEVELLRGTPIEKIERKSKGVTSTATRVQPDETRAVGLFVPDTARLFLDQILLDYATGPLTEKGQQPQRRDFVEPIETIRKAQFRTFYTDTDDSLPKDPVEPVWWEIWCVRESEAQLEALVERMGGRSAEKDQRLYFPETVIVPVLASKETVEIMLFARFMITEIRRASDTPVVFLEADREEQLGWVDDLARRVRWPGVGVPAVCLLDTGVNRAHHLIEPSLAREDMEAVKNDWGVADDTGGHGTAMSGIALYGDLKTPLESGEELILKHRLESVKLLPPPGFPATQERFYGPGTQSAIVLPEIRQAGRPRVYCMAISNKSVSGDQPSGWSAAIDQAASGSMIGDSERKRRLIILSTGNAPNHIERDRLQSPDEYPIEDPAQAWNALTVGGYTDKTEIQDKGLEDYEPYSKSGDLSPHTRTSARWRGKTPFKPDIVMEAGNRAVSPSGRDVLDAESLALLSTGSNTDLQPLVPFRATSAAAAAAARMAARLMADHPNYWPETIRALIIHGAEWTKPMKAELDKAGNMTERAALIRRYGYGVPTFERANASANDHLALVAQAEIQPFASKKKAFEDIHFYKLPWPRNAIEKIGEETVRLKITLSYFIDPNPGS